MSTPDTNDPSPEGPAESVPSTPRPERPSPPEQGRDARTGEDHHILIAEKFIGSAMMFVGFLNVLLSISGGYEISTIPILLYCGGLAIWAHGAVENPTARYVVIALAILVGLVFFHFGEVLFWHKQLVFWGTVGLVVFFMFKGASQ